MQKTTIAILAVSIAAITVGFLATNSMLPTTYVIAQSNSPNIADKSAILGHVTYVVRGPDGHIISYAQTDNARTVQGVNCALQILFNKNNAASLNTNGTNVCGGSQGMILSSSTNYNGFNVIGLINGSGTLTGASSLGIIYGNGTDLPTTDATKGNQCGCGGTAGGRASSKDGYINHSGIATNEGAPQQATTITGGPTYNTVTLTSPAFAFSNTSGMSIRGSMLTNSTDPSKVAAFAENGFSGGSISVGSGDTLTVTWTITLT